VTPVARCAQRSRHIEKLDSRGESLLLAVFFDVGMEFKVSGCRAAEGQFQLRGPLPHIRITLFTGNAGRRNTRLPRDLPLTEPLPLLTNVDGRISGRSHKSLE
jgi:hypothetical protein